VLVFNGVALLLLTIPLWFYGHGPALIGAAIGNGVGVMNLAILAWSVSRAISKASQGRPALWGAVLGAKMLLIFVVLFVLIGVLKIHVVGFAIGFSSLLVGLVVAGLLTARTG
jgi:hypothetical protein